MSRLLAMVLMLTVSISVFPVPVQAVEIPGIEQAANDYQNPENADEVELFRLSLTSTLRHSKRTKDGTVYVQTGDIPAEWLRDASAQVRPYLLSLARVMTCGSIHMPTRSPPMIRSGKRSSN